jgi:hypothetical protein
VPNPTKSWGELRCFGRLNSSCSTTDTSCSVHLSFFYFFLCPILLRNWIVHFLLPLKLFCICLGRYISQRNLVKHTDHSSYCLLSWALLLYVFRLLIIIHKECFPILYCLYIYMQTGLLSCLITLLVIIFCPIDCRECAKYSQCQVRVPKSEDHIGKNVWKQMNLLSDLLGCNGIYRHLFTYLCHF